LHNQKLLKLKLAEGVNFDSNPVHEDLVMSLELSVKRLADELESFETKHESLIEIYKNSENEKQKSLFAQKREIEEKVKENEMFQIKIARYVKVIQSKTDENYKQEQMAY
jgi:hypothetical protein